MKKKNKEIKKKPELSEPIILALEREKYDSSLLKKYRKEKNQKINFKLLLLRLVFISLLICSSFYLYTWNKNNKQSSALLASLHQYINTNTEENLSEESFSVNFAELNNINPSCFAWLKVAGTSIDYPIVKYANNDYYLNHSFDNSSNPAGWPFADYKNTCNGEDKNLIIYGHNRMDGSMFSTLRNILNNDWYTNKDNYTLKLYTKYGGLIEYQVFSVYEIKAEGYYTTTTFLSDSSYKKFLDEIKNRSIYDFNIDLTIEDKILTLSTCSNNNAYRTVLHAKKISN